MRSFRKVAKLAILQRLTPLQNGRLGAKINITKPLYNPIPPNQCKKTANIPEMTSF